jgi:hypothetical protein
MLVELQLSIGLCRLLGTSGTNFDSDVASDEACISFSVHK